MQTARIKSSYTRVIKLLCRLPGVTSRCSCDYNNFYLKYNTCAKHYVWEYQFRKKNEDTSWVSYEPISRLSQTINSAGALAQITREIVNFALIYAYNWLATLRLSGIYEFTAYTLDYLNTNQDYSPHSKNMDNSQFVLPSCCTTVCQPRWCLIYTIQN